MHYTFQESFIWDGGPPLADPERKPFKTKRKNFERAQKALPKPDIGRVWHLIETDDPSVETVPVWTPPPVLW